MNGRPLVLVADDDATTRFLARNVLETGGFEVQEAGDGLEAVEAFQARPADLVLLDGWMPGQDGFAVCATLRGLPGGRNIPVLMLSGLEDADVLERALAAGVDEFIRKPLDYSELAGRLRLALARRERALPPREEVAVLLDPLLARARRENRRVGVLALEAGGDAETAGRLQAVLRQDDLVRGDPGGSWCCPDRSDGLWWIILPALESLEDAARVATRLLAGMGSAEGSSHAGIACFPEDGDSAPTLLGKARGALETARASGLELEVGDPVRGALARGRLARSRDLARELAEGRLEAYAAPVLDGAGGVLAARLGWARPGGSPAGPSLREARLEEEAMLGLLEVAAASRSRGASPAVRWVLPVPDGCVDSARLLDGLARLSMEGGLDWLELELDLRPARFSPGGLDLLGHLPGLGLVVGAGGITLDLESCERLSGLPLRGLFLAGEWLEAELSPHQRTGLRLLADWTHGRGWFLRAWGLRRPEILPSMGEAGVDQLEGPALGLPRRRLDLPNPFRAREER